MGVEGCPSSGHESWDELTERVEETHFEDV